MAYMRNGLDRGHGGGTPKKLDIFVVEKNWNF